MAPRLSDVVERHERTLDAPIHTAGRLIDEVTDPGGELWPSPPWWPLRLDRPLAVGARGGHGPVRYHVSAYDPGRRVRFDLDSVLGVRVIP
ncbi:hypothetical protein HDA39_002572 [Kribbella italica]|uniref:Uncharacterized protein n=1 Tax=Kribbella italica TaxID=1540520 RepID=A0A7W9J5E2_9ACTN|nr:hypothetical protein [Kribbella italica]